MFENGAAAQHIVCLSRLRVRLSVGANCAAVSRHTIDQQSNQRRQEQKHNVSYRCTDPERI